MNNRGKKVLYTITDEYAKKYNLAADFIGKNIVLYNNQISHLEKHRLEFSNSSSYDYSLKNMDDIVIQPDFICHDDRNNSLLFVKKMLDDTLVAVRISQATSLKVRTMYPITKAKRSHLLKKSITTKEM